MSLNSTQRLHRLQVRLEELACWRIRESLDINGWRCEGAPIAVGALWPHLEGVVHFAANAAPPVKWPLDDTRLSLNLGGESLLTLRYDSGAAAHFGVDPNHEEFPLQPGGFAIEAESVARLPFGQPVRAPHLTRACLIRLEPAVHRLALLLQQIGETVESLPDHEVTPHLLDAADAALQSLDWPSRSDDYIARIAATRRQQSIWRLPSAKPHPEGLNEAQRRSVGLAYDALVERLKTLQGRFPQQGEIALTGHAHIDLAWLWPYDETRRKMRRTFHTALSLMAQSKDFRFNQSTAHYYAQIEADDPELFARIAERVKAGQWEVLGGMWVEPDTNMPTGESLVRQILYGQRYFEKKFGARHRVCWLPDCFGFSGALPQLLRQGGIDSFFTIKFNWSETNKFPADLFWWEGLDGSRVLAHSFDNPMEGYNGRVQPDCLIPTWKNFRGKRHHPISLLAVGFGDGGGGVTPEMIEREIQLRDFPATPKARWTTVAAFFDDAHQRAGVQPLPVWSGEIYLELHRATLTSQSGVKRRHRAAERALITAETVSGLAHLLGAPAPQSLETLWRVVLKNEFHDILPGSSIAEVYRDAADELDAVIAAGLAAQRSAMLAIAAQLPRGEIADALVVVNPSLHPRQICATLDDGSFLASDEVAPPLGVVVVDRARLKHAPGLKASAGHLENEHLLAVFGPDGAIDSLIHKASGREALAGRGNQLWAYPQDKPRNWDAWDVEADYAARGEEIVGVERCELVENSLHRAAIRVARRYRHSMIVQTYRLAANGRRLDICTDIDWRDRRVFLRSLTPAAVRSASATFECAYGVVKRPTHENTSWDAAMFEAAAHRFIDLSDPGFGLALLNDAKYGHSVRGNVLGVSLLRSPVYPDPLADEGAQSFTYALMPHSGEWHAGGVREEAENLNQPLLAWRTQGLSPGAHSPLRTTGGTVALSGLKPAEEGAGLVLRVYEPAGARVACEIAPPPGWRARAVNLMEDPGAERKALGAFEVASWRLTKA